MDEEVFTDTTGISTFRQTLFYTPRDNDNNKTLRYGAIHTVIKAFFTLKFSPSFAVYTWEFY